nr:prepilin-type N-terminal cleavage/methylation domain-containing protein [Neobacillus sp. Marseille-Q6967]
MVKKLGLKLKEQKGFTLIELLAVIVILGIIAAIAIPAIGNVISKSKDKSMAQDGVQVINAAKMYVANNPDVIAPDATSGTSEELTKAQLDEYLDKSKASTYTVIVTKSDASSGKFSYKLSGGHPAITTVTDIDGDDATASEQELVNKAQ